MTTVSAPTRVSGIAPSTQAEETVDEGHRFGFKHWAGIAWLLSLRTFRLRYLRSKLGIGWVLIQPIIQAGVLAFIFTEVFKAARTPHYPLYVLAGVMTWQAFSGSVNTATTAALDNSSLLSKVAMPSVVFPVSQIVSTLLVLLFQLVVLVVIAIFSGTVGLDLLFLPLVPVLVALVAFGLSLITCALQVRYRDVKFIVESGLIVAFYASPVLYAPKALTPKLSGVLEYNPMYGVLALARTALLQQKFNGFSLILTIVESAVLILIGAVVFRRESPDFADLA